MSRYPRSAGVTVVKKNKNKDYERLIAENEQLAKSRADLIVLNKLASIIASTMPLDQVLRKVVAESVKAIGADQGKIELLEPGAGKANLLETSVQISASHKRCSVKLDTQITGWMLKNQRPLLVNGIAEDPTFLNSELARAGYYSLLSVPLISRGQLLGTLNLFNKTHHQDFSSGDRDFLAIIAAQSAQVIENARLYGEERQLLHYQEELSIAREIQQKLLPKMMPQIAGFDIAAASYPAAEVGADYFDFIELRAGRLGVAFGDVTGRGIPAALMLSNVQATLLNQVLNCENPYNCISRANRFLCDSTDQTQFVSLFFAILDPDRRRLTYVNAGHYPPLYLRAAEFRTLEATGPVAGVQSDFEYEEGSLSGQPGDILVIYSNGVIEAENAQGERFEESRLREILLRCGQWTATEIVVEINWSVRSFLAPAQVLDDITLVVIKVL